VSGKPAVTALHASTLCTRHGQRLDYVLAADTTAHLYLLQHGRIHARIPTPQIITAVSTLVNCVHVWPVSSIYTPTPTVHPIPTPHPYISVPTPPSVSLINNQFDKGLTFFPPSACASITRINQSMSLLNQINKTLGSIIQSNQINAITQSIRSITQSAFNSNPSQSINQISNHSINRDSIPIIPCVASSVVCLQMSSGRFVEPQSLENGENNPAFDHQVALGTDSGAIYIFTNFQVNTCNPFLS
jgi:hypothetical protein